MSSTKPAIVIVPGAWHHPSQYTPLASRLEKAGYEVTTCDLPSTGGAKPTASLSADIDVIRQAIISHLERNQNVALVCHSFGGITGSAAVQGLRPQDRDGKAGVLKLIYLTAAISEAGSTVLTAGGGKHNPCVHFPLPEPENEGFCGVYDPVKNFYNCCPPEVRGENVTKLRLFSEAPCHDIIPYAGWKDVESYYLICEKDNAFPVFVQEAFSSMEGGRWKRVERLDTDHSPVLSRPDETAEFVIRCVEDGE